MKRGINVFLLLSVMGFSTSVMPAEKIPNDVRYMLEDMYGEDKKNWPSPRYPQDLNNDGMKDWIAVKKGCLLKEKCAAEIFICIPNNKGGCFEYCYIEVKSLVNIVKILPTLKCEATC